MLWENTGHRFGMFLRRSKFCVGVNTTNVNIGYKTTSDSLFQFVGYVIFSPVALVLNFIRLHCTSVKLGVSVQYLTLSRLTVSVVTKRSKDMALTC